MFQVDRGQNRLRRLEQRRFGDLNLREREHLQEWLAHQPDALGEELLILQKEFDGFADTRERLDLLALDKDGQLVVIENKLDDSGRDVTWQALKYTAYVSSLTKAQIIDIFQQYRDRHAGGGNAARLICEFLEVEELDEVVLNPGHRQRLIFIAANFRKEVTSTVLWLREHQIDARCFKVTPYAFGDELLLDIQPVIPTPEAADFMIGMAEKESEQHQAKDRTTKKGQARRTYWTTLLDALSRQGSRAFAGIGPHKNHWLNGTTPIAGCAITLVLVKNEVRIELDMSRQDVGVRRHIFEALDRHACEATTALGAELSWISGADAADTQIQCALAADPYDQNGWDQLISWHVNAVEKWEAFFFPIMEEVGSTLPGLVKTA